MSKISVTEAEKLVSVGKSTIYADMETGKLSFEINGRGHKVVDPAELDRVYGLEKPPVPNGNGGNGTGSETGNYRKLLETAGSQNGNDRKVSETAQNGDESTVDVAFLHSEVARLESELETAGKREATLEARTDKLISMLAIEQEQTRLLMLPKPEPEPEPEQKQKKRESWLGYFRLKR